MNAGDKDMSEQVPVLIVGGSLVGLSASVLLAQHGVRHVLIERHRGTAIHPRAASFHQRTLEIFRYAGIQQAVERAAEREFVQNGAIIAVETLGGRELATFYANFNQGVEELSPTRRLFITQIGLEPVLRQRAKELGADLRYATELADIAQDQDGVEAVARPRDGGPERRIRARYMIATDGAHSPVRRALGIAMQGRGEFARCATIYFRADVRELLRGRNLSVVYVKQPRQLAFFRFSISGDSGFLAVFATFDSAGRRERILERDLATGECANLVRAALGAPDTFDVGIENVQYWDATASTAASFRQGRVFLAGDSAHPMPPTGGFGGNTGVADVHNLAWKLAVVLRGAADPQLLDSYDEERRPIGHLTVEQAYRRYVERVDPSLPANDLAANLADTAIELGAVYRSCAVISEPGDDAPVETPERPSGRPGTRLAHVWLDAEHSTIDLPDAGITLVAGPDGTDWQAAALALGLAARLLPGAACAIAGIEACGALLLRPDGVIAWRSRGATPNGAGILADVLRRLGYSAEPGMGVASRNSDRPSANFTVRPTQRLPPSRA
jgi:2-polyprenyl-6-methoxyphenol hydroxylase-like FAD-dependent oxidoreductase